MLDRLTAFMTGRHGTKAFVASLIVVLGTTTGAVVQAAAGGDGASDDSAAVAVNTKDDAEKVKLSFKVQKTHTDPADPTNAAVAYSSCENCRTIAISIQAVIVTEDPSVISPTNIAIAVNDNCSLCETYADARQHVITTDGPAKFSAEGKDRIKAIREEVKTLKQQEKNGDIPFDELKSRVDALSAELADVLADEFRASSAATPSATPTPSDLTPTPSDTAETPSSTPDATASGEPTVEPSPSAPTTSSPSETSAPSLSERLHT